MALCRTVRSLRYVENLGTAINAMSRFINSAAATAASWNENHHDLLPMRRSMAADRSRVVLVVLHLAMPRGEDMPLFPSEPEIARAVLGERWEQWKDKAVILDRKGLPPINPLMGGRYWPAVKAFFDVVNGLPLQSQTSGASMPVGVQVVPPRHDGVETFHGKKARTAHSRRPRSRA